MVLDFRIDFYQELEPLSLFQSAGTSHHVTPAVLLFSALL